MAKKKTSHRRRFSMRRRGISHKPKSIPILPILGGAIGVFASYEASSKNLTTSAGMKSFLDQLSMSYTGFNPATNKFNPSTLVRGWAPLIAGGIGHKLANRLGINQTLTRHGIPITF